MATALRPQPDSEQEDETEQDDSTELLNVEESRDEKDEEFVAYWVCDNPEETHDMGAEVEDSLEAIGHNYSYRDARNCSVCEGYNQAYTGHLDRVERQVNGSVEEVIDGETMKERFNM